MSKLILFYPKYRNEHKGKGLGMIPRFLFEKYNIKPFIMTYENEDKYDIYSGLNFLFIKGNILYYFINNILKLNPNFIMFSHVKLETLVFTLIVKLIKPKIKIFIRGDANFKPAGKLNWRGKYIGPIINKILYFILPKYCLISIETFHALNYIKKKFNKKLLHLPNGYYGSENYSLTLDKKENIVTTMSKLGTYAKNTKMFLNVAKYVITKNDKIKFYAIGDIYNDENFLKYLDEFKKNNKKVFKNIFFVGYKEGNLKIDLLEISKIFLMTSRFEGFANVFPEAGYYGNLIVSTNVGGAYEVTDKGRLGKIIDYSTDIDFIEKAGNYILNNINGGDLINESIKQHNFIKENMLYTNLVEKLYYNLKK